MCIIKELKVGILSASSLNRKKKWLGQSYPASLPQQKPSQVVSLEGVIIDFNLFKYTSVLFEFFLQLDVSCFLKNKT